jgi:hypothetical protein
MSNDTASPNPQDDGANAAQGLTPPVGRHEASCSGEFGFWRHKSLEELAAEQGVRPIEDPEALLGDFWPEEESTEDFLAWLRKLRRDGREAD